MTANPDSGLRIDRWLWFARFYKTRPLAAKAVAGGHVRINGARARPGHKVTPGDRIELVRDQLPYQPEVLALPLRRGSAADAACCYRESDATRLRREAIIGQLRHDRMQMPRTNGRPDKHTRRKLRERNREY
jgi:ribosome-associated heat shock protein Hsp15